MTTVHQLINRGAAAIQQQFGTDASLARAGVTYWSGPLVWVEISSSYAVEFGGSVYAVTGKCAVLASTLTQPPLPGDRLTVNGRLLLVVSVFKSSFDATYNLEATSLQ